MTLSTPFKIWVAGALFFMSLPSCFAGDWLQMLTGPTQEEGPVLLAFSALDPAISLEDLQLSLDGSVLNHGVERDQWLVTWQGDLEAGEHRIEAFIPGQSDLPVLQLNLQVKGPKLRERKFHLSSWQEAASNRLDSRDALGADLWQHQHRMQVRLHASIGSGKKAWDLRSRVLLEGSDWFEDVLTPQSRFELDLSHSYWRLGLGDRRPKFDELLLNGQRVRGFELSYDSPLFGFRTVSGLSQNAASILSRSDSLGEYRSSQFERKLHAVDFRFGSKSGYLESGITIIKAKDTVGSLADFETLNAGTSDSLHHVTPQDNLGLALRMNTRLFGGRLQGRNEVALTLNNSDISGGPLSESDLDSLGVEDFPDPSNFEKFIVLNEYFSPLNIKDDPTSAMALLSKWDLRLPGQHLQLAFTQVGTAFNSLGQPYLGTDQQHIRIQDQFRFAENQIFVDAGVDLSRDNLNGAMDDFVGTTGRGLYSLSCSWFPKGRALSLRSFFSLESEENEALDRMIQDSPASIDDAHAQQVDAQTMVVSLGGQASWPALREGARVDASLRWTSLDDAVGSILSSDSTLLRSDMAYSSLRLYSRLHLPVGVLQIAPAFEVSSTTRENVNQGDQQQIGLSVDLRPLTKHDRDWSTSLRLLNDKQDIGDQTEKSVLVDVGCHGYQKINENTQFSGNLSWRGEFGDRDDSFFAFTLRLSQSY